MSSTDMTTVAIAVGGIISGMKRKAVELGEHALSAVVGHLGGRILSAAEGWYEAHASVDDQLARLRTLLIMVHSAVDEAERVHIASWWLRRWLWALRDAVLDADEVLRLFRSRQQRAAEEEAARRQQRAAGSTPWNAAARVLRSARRPLSPLLSRDDDDDDGTQRLRRALAAGLGDFLKLLDLEIRTRHRQNTATLDDVGEEDEHVVAGTTNMGLLIVRQHIRRPARSLIRKPPPPPATRAMVPDAGELQAVASSAERVLLSLPVRADPDRIHFAVDDGGEEDGAERGGLCHADQVSSEADGDAYADAPAARWEGGHPLHPQASSFFFLSHLLVLLFSLCVAAALLWWRHGWAEVNDRRRALPRW